MRGELEVAFVQALRQAGLPVPTGCTVLFAEALAETADVYWAGRATLVRRPEHVPVYDRVFAGFFSKLRSEGAHVRSNERNLGRVVREVEVRWSPTEVLRHKDLAECTPAELDEAHRLIAGLRAHPVRRRSRRRVAGRPGRGRPDLRRSVRRAVATGGELVRPATTEPGTRPRRLVLLLDVSGSMAPYSRALARFAHAAVVARRPGQVEVFTLGTRTTRITRSLGTHDPDRALRDAAAAVADWDGGTRLGQGVGRFNDRWGGEGTARGSLVVVLSDGWDRGDPVELGTEMARLRRVAHRVVWVNPLKASPGYAPLARGMAAALPHVDAFVEGHSVASLEELAQVIST